MPAQLTRNTNHNGTEMMREDMICPSCDRESGKGAALVKCAEFD